PVQRRTLRRQHHPVRRSVDVSHRRPDLGRHHALRILHPTDTAVRLARKEAEHMPRTHNTRRGSAVALIAIALSLAGVATACSGGASATGGPSATPSTTAARPSSPAKITILSPRNGQVITGSNVRLRVTLSGGHVVQPTTTPITPTQGHLHVFGVNK